MTAIDGFSGVETEQAVVAAFDCALHLQKPLDIAILLDVIKATFPLSVSRREALQKLRAIAHKWVSIR